jgi:5-oxoprolinase (ATP-hydrolysing)
VSQGAKDVRTDLWAHLRYSGTQDLKVAFDGRFHATRLRPHLSRFGFTSPDAPILFEMLSVEAIGEAAHENAQRHQLSSR